MAKEKIIIVYSCEFCPERDVDKCTLLMKKIDNLKERNRDCPLMNK